MQTKGRVVIVGVCDVEGSTNLYMAKAFERLGYEVIPCNYRTILKKHGPKTLGTVLQKLSEDKPSLMLFSKCNGIESHLIARCSLNCKTWLWFMDPISTLRGIPEIIDHANMADYVSATGLGVAVEISKGIGGAEVHHIMEGVDPEIYRPTIQSQEFVANVSFIGTANPERMVYVQTLSEAGIDIKAYGDGFGHEVHGNIFNLVCSSSASMLALNTEHTTPEYFSDRVFRLGACGAFVFHSFSPRMDKYFIDGEDLVYFDTPQSLVEAIKFYFHPDRENLRTQIRHNLRNKILSNHTWEHTIQRIIEIAEI
jgi:spore maturation protein CgeB